MDSLIRETNENLNVILSTLKNNLDNSESTLENIQINMDKKVEEAKKYKVQVDSAKDKIRELEDDNKSLELSLKELNDRYGKMNLVSLVETGNKEIKTKINENNKEINRQKEQIADLTNKARTIKDLLINLKKDKTIKEERLENLKIVYNYYETRINEIIDFAFNHSENLSEYKAISYNFDEEFDNVEINDSELENTMVFDEIANIDENKNFKDEMTFIDGQIDETYNNIDDLINKTLNNYNIEEDDEVKVNEKDIDSTQVFDSIINEVDEKEIAENNEEIVFNNSDLFIQDEEKLETKEENIPDLSVLDDNEQDSEIVLEENKEEINLNDSILETELEKTEEDYKTINNLDVFNISDDENLTDTSLLKEIDDSEERISKIDDLFTSINNTKTSNIPTNAVSGIENEIDSAYKDIFGVSLNEKDLNKTVTLTDIFGNPIKKEEISEEIKKEKKIEELFVENGIDFNKFKEDEQNYLKQIYDEEKFNNTLSTLNRNKINLDNLYHACNIFGEISADELENIINLLISSGQTVEAVGLILEKLPKVKKYNLSDAINSYGDYIKDIDITELIMKAKELYDGGNI